MLIELLICTIDDRIKRVEELLLPPMEGVCYLVAWQNSERYAGKAEHDRIPIFLENRKDVRLIRTEGHGLSRNRNTALRQARGDLLAISDDDCTYTEQGIANIREAFSRHPDADIIQFQAYTPEGHPHNPYSKQSFNFANRPRFTFFASFELVVRRCARLPHFDERFGIGAYLGCGEEEVFIENAMQNGLRVYYEPLMLCVSPDGATGTRFLTSKSVQRAKGGTLTVIHGPLPAFARCVKYAFHYAQTPFMKRFRLLGEMTKGIVYVLTHHPIP